MNLEVLISCMNQQDMRIAEQTGIQTDALIVNQCMQAESSEDVSLDCNAIEVQNGSRGNIRMIRSSMLSEMHVFSAMTMNSWIHPIRIPS